MVVIDNARLVERRIKALRGRRESLSAARSSEAGLPEWASDVLLHAGMTRAEIRAFEVEPATVAEVDVDAECRELDDAIERLEDELMSRPIESFGALRALAEVGIARLQRAVATDPDDVFYDAGEARALALLDRVVRELQDYEPASLRRVG